MHPLVVAIAISLHALMFAMAILVAIIVHRLAIWLLSPLLKRTTHAFGETVLTYCQTPAKWFLILSACEIVLENIRLPERLRDGVSHVIKLGMVGLVAWFTLALLHVCRDWILRRYEVTNPDNLNARRVHTQIKLLEKVIFTLVILITVGCMLMTFDGIRQIGASLIASAGIAGVILGFAAQKVLASLLAGIQIAISEPFRIDDVVIVEGEWGQIEEITLTYVVVRIWDLRRLVLPMSYFIEKPFQNWTRTSADLLGTSFFYLDVATDLVPLRAEFERIVKASPRWDGKVQGMQVTNISERTIEVRCLMSSANASVSFDLRCEVREKLLMYMREHQPQAFPRMRVANDPMEVVAPMPTRENLSGQPSH